MLWTSDKPRSTLSLAKRLTYLYILSTIGLLLVIALIFFPSLARILTDASLNLDPEITMMCIRQIIVMVLSVILGVVLIGHFITRRGLKHIHLLQQTMARMSADDLDERLDIQSWPNELKSVGEQFNRMIERLNSAFQQLSQFSSDIAHELRHPIHHLQQMTEMELSKPDLDRARQDLLVGFIDEFKMLSTLVEQLLFIARSEQKQILLQKKQIALSSFIHKLIDYYSAWAKEKEIIIECTGDSLLIADPILLQRAISNLLANSIQYTPAQGAISVHITTLQYAVHIDIVDNGVGITEDQLPFVLQRFYQANSARTNHGSLGLGLPIVKSIMDLHQANLFIMSEPGKGTKVSMQFSRV